MNETTEQTMGERIRELRKKRDLTLQQVGDEFGINRSSVSAWETNSSRPDPEKLSKLAFVLGTTVEYLLTGKEIPLERVIRKRELDGITLTSSDDTPRPVEVRDYEERLPRLYSAGSRRIADQQRPRMDGSVPLLEWAHAGYYFLDRDKVPEKLAQTGTVLPLLQGGVLALPENEPTTITYSRLMNVVRPPRVRCPFRYSRSAFALQMRDMSGFVGENRMSIHEGDYIAVDPQRDLDVGDLVIARKEGQREAFLRQYFVDSQNDEMLLAINLEHPGNQDMQLSQGISIIGVVIGLWREF